MHDYPAMVTGPQGTNAMFFGIKKRTSLRNRVSIGICVLLLMHYALVASQAINNFPVVDELAHLPAGVVHWQHKDFSFYRVNPPLARMVATLPFLWACYKSDLRAIDPLKYEGHGRPEFSAGFELLEAKGTGLQAEYILPRLICALFSLLGAAALAAWVYQVSGATASLAATIFWTLSPNIISNAATIGPDLAATATGVCASYALWKWGQKPLVSRSVICGFALGAAMLCKSTWLIGLLVFPSCLAFMWYFGSGSKFSIYKLVSQAFVFTLVALLTINAGYAFTNSLVPLGEFEFVSETLGGKRPPSEYTGNVFRNSFLASVPVVLPEDYLLGIDYLKMEVEHGMASFLAGEVRHGSWWYYYLATVCLKTPIGLLVLIGLALPFIARKEFLISVVIPLGVPSAVLFISVSAAGGFNHHHRYVLPVYPMLFFLAASTFESRDPLTREFKVIRLFAFTCFIISCMLAAKHPHSHFNAIAGGPNNGYRWLSYSNVEWGQDLLLLGEWVATRKSGKEVLFVELAYPAQASRLFGRNVHDFDEIEHLLHEQEFQELVQEEGLLIALHVTILSDYPSSAITRVVRDRPVFYRICPAYAVFRFKGEDDLTDLKNVFNRQSL